MEETIRLLSIILLLLYVDNLFEIKISKVAKQKTHRHIHTHTLKRRLLNIIKIVCQLGTDLLQLN